MPKPTQFRFKLPKKLYGKKLYLIKKELEALQPLTEQEEGKAWREPILTNYGCACFHFNYDDDKLLELYTNYVSDKIKAEIEEKLGDTISIENVLYETLGKEKYKAVLNKMLKEHPDIMSSCLIQVVLATVPLEIEYDNYLIEDTVKLLKRNLEAMAKISELDEEYSVSLDHGYTALDSEEDEEKRLTVYIDDFNLEPDETLEDLEKRIDKIINPLKNCIELKARTDLLLHP